MVTNVVRVKCLGNDESVVSTTNIMLGCLLSVLWFSFTIGMYCLCSHYENNPIGVL